MKRLFVLLMGLSFGVIAVTPNPTAMGAGATTFSTTPMVPTYKKPALPPEQTEEELVEEDPTKQAIKNTAIAGGVLLGSNLILKGFSNKYMKEACLSQNFAHTYSKTDKNDKEVGAKTNYYYAWDTKFSFKANENEKCLTCCPYEEDADDVTQKDLKKVEDDRKKAKALCDAMEKESPEQKNCLKELEKTDSNASNCVRDDDKCGEEIYNQQMYQFCNKKKFKGVAPCPSKKSKD